MSAPEPDAFARVVEAMSRKGKPRGDHMIAGFKMLADYNHAGSKQQKQMGDTYALASVCIKNETRMFDELRAAVSDALGLSFDDDSVPTEPPQDDEPVSVPA